jgi:hypothetical protein
MTSGEETVCNSRPDCPCEFCTDNREDMKANPQPLRYLPRDEERSLVDDFLREFQRGKSGE